MDMIKFEICSGRIKICDCHHENKHCSLCSYGLTSKEVINYSGQIKGISKIKEDKNGLDK